MNISYVDSTVQKPWSVVYTNPDKPVIKLSVVEKKIVPDVRNMGLKDALYLLENSSIKVITKGRGKVVAQDILPGTPVTKNQNITLLLN
jgi:cell division protein FtsI (penicillin-binding protein 3)